MNSPDAAEGRLGLLQCPNSAALGWGGGNDDANREDVDVTDVHDEVTATASTEGDAVSSSSLQRNQSTTDPPATFASIGDPSKEFVVSSFQQKTTATDTGVDVVSTFDVSASVQTDIIATTNEANNLDKISASQSTQSQINLYSNSTLLHPVQTSDCDQIQEENGDDGSPQKRPRLLEAKQLPQDSENDDQKQHTASNKMKIDDTKSKTPATETANDTSTPPSQAPLTISLEYETSCPFAKAQENTSSALDSNSQRSQILTLTYHGGYSTLENDASTVVGTISGMARLEVLPPLSSVNEDAYSTLSLDVFGYRLSQTSVDKFIFINRPEWMNELPLSVVVHGKHEVTNLMTLRVRIQSTKDIDMYSTEETDDKSNYYSAYPEDSYQLNVLSQSAIFPGNFKRTGNGVITIFKSWKDSVDTIVDAINCKNDSNTTKIENSNRILICGAKGVGKSTCLRYVTNRLLSTQLTIKCKRQVAILDVDCGQSELSPPGMMTLTILSRPLLSDPPLHMVCGGSGNHISQQQTEDAIDQVASYFYGDITSKADPDTFINMTTQLMRTYAKLVAGSSTACPLVVNTDGWVKGLGAEILAAVIGATNPCHVVQILGSTRAKTFELPPQFTGSTLQQRAVYSIQSYDESVVSDGIGEVSRRSSMNSYASSTGPLLASASEHRSHRLCAYFLGGYTNMTSLTSSTVGEDEVMTFHKEKGLCDPNNIIGLTIARMRPYAVPFHSVNVYPPSGMLDNVSDVSPIWGVRGDLAGSDVLESLNGAVVGLCCKPDEFDASLTNCNAGVGVPIRPCHGLGIIRSIDHNRRIFFVLTPVHPRLLSNVTSIVGGNIGLPLECVFRGVQSDSFPFLTCAHSLATPSFGADVMKSRNHSGRKK